MTPILAIDWSQMFLPEGHLLEVVVRGFVMYTALFILLRVRRREAGSLGIADLLLIVLIADAAQNAMAGPHHSLAEGLVLVLTLIGCDYAVDWLGFTFPRLRPWLRAAPLTLIRDGQLMRANMRKEMVTATSCSPSCVNRASTIRPR
ncbi:MAG: DUF421 domain-containing protein [Phycisphaerae bacterium]|nr:DUF421 domain-containing protein [Phycisphaerae bacterium]